MKHEFDLERAQRHARAMQLAPSARLREVATLKRVLNSFNIMNCSAIADLGAGMGHLGHNILEYLSAEGRVYAVDVSPTMLTFLRQTARVHAVLGSYDHFSFDSGSIDLVVSIGVLHHITNKRQVFEELRRVLRDTGYFVFADVHDGTGTQAFFDHTVRRHCCSGHPYDFLDEEWVRMLARKSGMACLFSQVVDTVWEFCSEGEMLAFLTDLFSLNITEDDLRRELDRTLPPWMENNHIFLPWQLGYHVLRKKLG
jgi:ubiquinone/menaquinone biosynthesis C-methylase UbiE